MTSIKRSALVEHSAEEMFDLVNDIEQYPKFMAGCTSARVIESSETELLGELTLGKAGISQCFVTRNSLNRPHAIIMNLEEGNFSSFDARWDFKELGDNACKVSLVMEFEFDSSLMNFALEKLFASVANNLVDAIVNRSHQVYG
ncbi:MAG: type II toxin-antitoxin system RatA family toxin [Pseudomonadales bacterium]|nr:type II toxin-antitoxin system RatA family toxin [Pseudomonadales bacterium]